MRLDAQGQLGQLTYCTNIHAGEHWPDVAASLKANLPLIREQTCPGERLGVGLRISAGMARELSEGAEFAELENLLGDDFHVFTVNAFPYGAFHGQTVKDGAYRPDWTDPERLRYTNQTADVLARLLAEGELGTLSTVPCSFKGWHSPARLSPVLDQCAAHIGAHAAHLAQLERDTGRHVQLAIEPEPFCALETIEETRAFFAERLFSGAGAVAFRKIAGVGESAAREQMQRYVGVCYDVCHAAVEFEDAAASLAALRHDGIAISKLQLSSALRVGTVTPDSAAALAEFDEPVYLHQTIQRSAGGITRFADISEALAHRASAMGAGETDAEWRSHFHVPIFLDRMEHFDTTQAFLCEVLDVHRTTPVTTQLEVETYTWDVLPAQYRNVPIADAIARELRWVIDRLLPAGRAPGGAA